MRRLVAVGLGLALLAPACSDDADGSAEPPRNGAVAPTTTVTPELTVLEDTAGRLVLGFGSVRLDVGLRPLSITADQGDRTVVESTGITLTRGGRERALGATRLLRAGPAQATLASRVDGGGRVGVGLRVLDDSTLSVSLELDEPGRYTDWTQRLRLRPDERIYGLTERTVSDLIDSEIEPTADGTLDRRGEVVDLSIVPTIAAYAPFHQSSAGYGMWVGGTMAGRYDVGASDPDVLRVSFATNRRSDLGFALFFGDHPTILREYTELTGRAPVPPDYVFRHWRGRDEFEVGPTVEYEGVELNAELADELRHYDELGLPPPGVFHLDRPWGTGPEGYGELEFDDERWGDPEGMLQLLQERGSHPWVWISNWAIGERGREARRLGYLAPGSDRAIDFTNPDAAQWFRNGLTEFLEGEGSLVDGFFIDRGDEPDVPSEHDDVYADGRRGDEVHNAYPVLMQENVREVLDEERPEDGYAIARAAYTQTQRYVATWGGDTHSRTGFQIPEAPPSGESTDLGLRSVLVSMQRSAFLGLPFWGSDIGGYSEFADREVYARWIEVGALSPLMRFHGKGSDLPWDMPTDPHDDAEATEIYARYLRLHESLVPYLVDLAREAHETGLTPVRPLVFRWPDEPEAGDAWDEWLLGDDLLVAPVWRSGSRARRVWFPPGRWVDVFDRATVIEGPTTRRVRAPLDVVPLYAAEGSEVLDQVET